jgi:hypothetical protein
MLHRTTFLAAAAFASLLAAGDAPAGKFTNAQHRDSTPTGEYPSAADYVRFKMARVMDNTGFGQPVEAMRLLVPADWKIESFVRWRQDRIGCLYMLVDVGLRATAPDGITALEAFPAYYWQWYDDPVNRQMVQQQANMGGARPCDLAPIVSPTDYLKGKVLRDYRRGSQVVQTEPLPEVARAFSASLQPTLQQYRQAGVQVDMRGDAGRVKIAYQVNGQPVEEWIVAVLMYTKQMQQSGSAAYQGTMGQAPAYGAYATYQFATRAPQGKLESYQRLFTTMLSSLRANPQWTAAVQQVVANMNNTANQGAMDRARIWSQAQREMGDMQRESYNAQQQSQTRIAEAWSQTTRGVETYVDPGSHERVELSSGYQGAWSNGQGEYILSDDPNFDPRNLQGNWREMQKPRN